MELQRILEAKHAFQDDKDTDDERNEFFNEVSLGDKKEAGDNHRDSCDKFGGLGATFFGAQECDEIIYGVKDKNATDGHRNAVHDFVGPNQEADTECQHDEVDEDWRDNVC